MKRGFFKSIAVAAALLMATTEALATSCYSDMMGGCQGPMTMAGSDQMQCEMGMMGTWYPDSDDCTSGVGLSSASPANGDKHVLLSDNMTMTFGENIVAGTGTIELKKDSDDSVVESFVITDNSDVTINNATLTLLKSTTLDKNTIYYLTIPETAIISSSDNTKTFPGYADNTGLKFSTNYEPALATISDVTLGVNAATHTIDLNPLVDADNVTINFSHDGTADAFANLSFSQLSQIGSDIDGEAQYDNSGYSVALSNDGSIMAIGAIGNDGTAGSAGHVRVYQNDNGTWTQIGADIDGEAGNDESGYSVALSSDGSIVAIGAIKNDGTASSAGHVRVYQNNNGTWIQIGSDIDGAAEDDRSGNSVALSSDGSIVAIGALFNDNYTGHVRVYEYIGDTWIQIGSDIDGEAEYDRSGKSVALSSDGSIVAIGATGNDGTASGAGHVRVYQNDNGTWTQIGSDIDGEAASDQSGFSVALSNDGSIVAIGAIKNDGTAGSDAGHVRVYQYDNGTWTQIGLDIDGEAADDESGVSVALSSDGSIVAIGAKKNDGTASDAGHVRVYQNISGTWTQIVSDLDGEAEGDYSGSSVALSSDGSIVAIGAVNNDGTASSAGHVRVYSTQNTLAVTPITDASGQATVTVSANDGYDTIEQSFTLTVGDPNPAPTSPVITNTTTNFLNNDSSSVTLSGDGSYSYSIIGGDDDNEMFTIENGELKFKDGVDTSIKSIYTVTIEADNGVSTTTKTLKIAIGSDVEFNYQGYLAKGTQAVNDSNLSMSFKLYNSETNTTALWTSNKEVNVTNGIYSVKLGEDNSFGSLDFLDTEYYLGITIKNNSEMSPRQKIAPNGYTKILAEKVKLLELNN